jgi:hypothetical protein
LRAALQISQKLGKIFQTPDEPIAFPFPVGVASGKSFAGLVGSDIRASYTVNGVVTNLAARLMGLASKEKTGVLCDRDTLASANDDVISQVLGHFELKGWSEPVEVIRVTKMKDRDVQASGRAGPVPLTKKRDLKIECGTIVESDDGNEANHRHGSVKLAESEVIGYAAEQSYVREAIDDYSYDRNRVGCIVIEVRFRFSWSAILLSRPHESPLPLLQYLHSTKGPSGSGKSTLTKKIEADTSGLLLW